MFIVLGVEWVSPVRSWWSWEGRTAPGPAGLDSQDAIKAYKAVVGVYLSESGVDYVAAITDVLGQPS